jgi:hypothetical protein
MAEKPTQDLSSVLRNQEPFLPMSHDTTTNPVTTHDARGLDKPMRAEDTQPKSESSASSNRVANVSDTKKEPAKPSDTVASREGTESARTTTKEPAESSRTDENGTKPATSQVVAAQRGDEAVRPAKEAVKPAEGTLSVYFLGGVGEFFVNGKRFAYQPPFEGVNIAAGTYRMACRMSGDTAPREFTVTIQSNRETVVEYEIGKDPTVTTE